MNFTQEQLDFAEAYYMNKAQMKALLIDPNVLIAEIARAGGKTEGIMGPRMINVANAMPRELAFLVHKTYASLLSNIVPNLTAYFNKPILDGSRTMLKEEEDYVLGTAKLPKHFNKPRYDVVYPKHSIIFRNGFNLQLVASDQPDSVAGRSGVHAFIEEMKHQKGIKLKSRLFPALRGSDNPKVRNSHYYQGITGVSDTARVDLGEDNWFEEYEENVDIERIHEIANVSYKVNSELHTKLAYEFLENEAKKANYANTELNNLLELQLLDYERAKRALENWQPKLSDMRRNASYYMRASSFVNKDFLGAKFFQTQAETLDIDELLTSICAIRLRAVENRFFANYKPNIHQFSDTYKNNLLYNIDLRDKFTIDARYLKYYDPKDELLLGYDPGNFQSLVVSQEKKGGSEIRTIKEFTCWTPKDQTHLAMEFNSFFGEYSQNKIIKLYADRAGNKRKEERDQITTDTKILKRELESYGFNVEIMTEGQQTIYHWEQKKLLDFMFHHNSKSFPKPYICENQCKYLCSAIMLSPLKNVAGKIELDKSSEKTLPFRLQGPRSTQLPSALIYFYFGRYADKLPKEFSDYPTDLPLEVGI